MDQKVLKALLTQLFMAIKIMAAGRPLILLAVSALEDFLKTRTAVLAKAMESDKK